MTMITRRRIRPSRIAVALSPLSPAHGTRPSSCVVLMRMRMRMADGLGEIVLLLVGAEGDSALVSVRWNAGW